MAQTEIRMTFDTQQQYSDFLANLVISPYWKFEYLSFNSLEDELKNVRHEVVFVVQMPRTDEIPHLIERIRESQKNRALKNNVVLLDLYGGSEGIELQFPPNIQIVRLSPHLSELLTAFYYAIEPRDSSRS